MIVKKKDRSYATHRKHVVGKGFVDSMSTALKNVGSYLYENKNLITKPLISAAGELAAYGLTEVGKKQLYNLINKKNKSGAELTGKDSEILQNILTTQNIIGSGIKKF